MALDLLGKSHIEGKKTVSNTEKLVIDISENQLTVNGESVYIPCHINELKKLFGKPRRLADKENGMTSFIWDDMGIYCRAHRYAVIHYLVCCIGIKTAVGEYSAAFAPKSTFKGTLTIGGEPWEEIMSGGEDINIARKRDIFELSLLSEYVDMEKGDADGFRGAYAGLEIYLQLYE